VLHFNVKVKGGRAARCARRRPVEGIRELRERIEDLRADKMADNIAKQYPVSAASLCGQSTRGSFCGLRRAGESAIRVNLAW
jgi:hypothetical protein